MENLNAEFIIKSLEYFIEDECASRTVVHDALALITSQEQRIKELTEENEKLTINMNAYGLTAKRLGEENESLKQAMEHEHHSFMEIFGQYGEKCDRLAEENERLRAIPERICEEARQMCFIVGDEEYVTLCELDQIKKEMLDNG